MSKKPKNSRGQLNRTPPIDVRRALQEEVGFVCPVDGCGSPYLTWHHFHPRWATRPHHDVLGMIALCEEHHTQADSLAWTVEQLRTMKMKRREVGTPISARLNWMRNDLLVIAGGNFYYNCENVVTWRGETVLGFSSSADGCRLLNIRLIGPGGRERLVVTENYWIVRDEPAEFDCPPSGKSLSVAFSDNDYLKLRFHEVNSLESFIEQYYEPIAAGSTDALLRSDKFPREWVADIGRDCLTPSLKPNRSAVLGHLKETMMFPITVLSVELSEGRRGIQLHRFRTDGDGFKSLPASLTCCLFHNIRTIYAI